MSFQENKNNIITVCVIVFISLIFYSIIDTKDKEISNLESQIQELEYKIEDIEYTANGAKELAEENESRISDIENELDY